jgi:hypothetical protein
MLSFFRVSTTYKYFFWFIVLLALRLPVVLGGIPVLNPELKWVIVAEQMHKGYFLYTDIWDNVPPLSALVYWVMYAMEGRNFFISHLFATFLIAIQAILFNQILHIKQVFNERTLLPALLYSVLMSLFLDFYVLSAPLLANTVLIIVLYYIFSHLSEKWRFNAMFEIGAYIGIATLFYFPSCTFLIVPLIAFPLYTPTPARDYALMLIAFVFTLGIAFLGFFLTNSEYDFWLCFFSSHLKFNTLQYLNGWEILILILPLGALMLGCIMQSRSYRNYSNYQDRSQNIMYLWFWVGLLNVVLSNEVSGFSFMPMMLALTFAFTHFALQFRFNWISELIFTALVSYTLFFTYTTQQKQELRVAIPYLEWANWRVTLPAQDLLAETPKNVNLYKGKKIWVSGHNLGAYKYAKPATPYLNTRLAQRHLKQLDEYNTLATVYKYFQRDLPEVIIDQNGQASYLFKQVPLLAKKYEPIKEAKHIYILK